MTMKTLAPLLLLGLAASACTGEDAGQGNLQLVFSGGRAVDEGYPHDETDVGRLEFVEGWQVSIDKMLVVVANVRLTEQLADGASGTGETVAEWAGPGLMDLTNPTSGTELPILADVPAVRYDLGFDFVDASAEIENISADATDLDRMAANGWTLLIEGEATKTGTTVAFSVGLSAPARFSKCTNGKDNTRGIAIEASKTTSAFVYPHTPHLWWDELVGNNAKLRFDSWAAAAGPDGVVTAEDLATQALLDLHAADGSPLLDPDTGNQVRYDDGGLLPTSQLDLLSYVIYGFRQSAHFNGLGFCPWTPL